MTTDTESATTIATIDTLSAAIETAKAAFDGSIDWECLAADADTAEAALAGDDKAERRIRRALAEGECNHTWLRDDGSYGSQQHRIALRGLVGMSDAPIAEIAETLRTLADEEAADVAAVAESAADYGDEALAYAREGAWGSALRAVRLACGCEREYGDSPAWGPVARLVEAMAEAAGG